MKNPLEITQYVLNGMIGIGGIPTNQEFYDEFNDRLKEALSVSDVVGQSEQLKAKERLVEISMQGYDEWDVTEMVMLIQSL